MMIEIKSVSLDYGVKDLDLTIQKGEFLLLCLWIGILLLPSV